MIIDPKILLSAVAAAGPSLSVDVHEVSNMTFSIVASSVGDTGATVAIQSSLDGTNWFTLYFKAVEANSVEEFSISQQSHKYIRANVTAYTDGVYTVSMIAQYC